MNVKNYILPAAVMQKQQQHQRYRAFFTKSEIVGFSMGSTYLQAALLGNLMFFASSCFNDKIKTPLVVPCCSIECLVTLSLLTCRMQISVTKSLHCIVMKNVNSPASIGRVFTVQAIFYPRLGSCKKNGWSEYKEQKLQNYQGICRISMLFDPIILGSKIGLIWFLHYIM